MIGVCGNRNKKGEEESQIDKRIHFHHLLLLQQKLDKDEETTGLYLKSLNPG